MSIERENMVKTTLIVFAIIAVLAVLLLGSRMFERVDAGEIVIIQDPIDGDLHVYTQQGLKWQNFGQATRYKKSFQYWFSSHEDQGARVDQSIKVRFNDGGHARISGSVRADLPLNHEILKDIHKMFGSQQAVEQELIRTVIEKSVYMTGVLMSSKESYADRRNELINYISDQAALGVFKTVPEETKTIDPVTGAEKTVTVVRISYDEKGNYLLQEVSPLKRFGIKIYNLSLNSIKYDDTVEKQIASQQKAIMRVQTAIAEAKEAEQRRITAEENGKANAETAKWEEEVKKTRAVVAARQRFEVAELDRKTAEQTKARDILLGEGEAERKKLVMAADGALSQKLDAWIKVNETYASSIANYKGAWVPGVVMGGSGRDARAGSGANDLINMLLVKTARELNLDMAIK